MANDYQFTKQPAAGVSLVGRFPAFTLQNPADKTKGLTLVGVNWPVYSDPKWNLHHTRGPIVTERYVSAALVPGKDAAESHFAWAAMWTNAAHTAITASVPLNIRREAAAFAGFEGFDPFINTPEYASLYPSVQSAVSGSHYLPTLAETGYAIGLDAYHEWRDQPVLENFSPRYNYFNSEIQEVPAGFDYTVLMSRISGQITKAFTDAYAADTAPNKPPYAPIWISYSIPSSNTESQFASEATGNGNPQYYLNTPAAFSDTALMAAYNASGSHMSHDTYQRCLWGPATDFFQRAANGTVLLSGNVEQWNRAAHTYTEQGFTVQIEANEGQHALHEIYRNIGCVVSNKFHLNNGQYPVRYSSRKAGWENIGESTWDRTTNESGTYIPNIAAVTNASNNRPLPLYLAEGNAFVKGFLTGYKGSHVTWQAAFNNKADGARPNAGEKNWVTGGNQNDQGTDGVREYFMKAYFRLSLLKDFLYNDGKLCLYTHPYRNAKATVGDRFVDAPILVGKIAMLDGQMTHVVVMWWPALRETDTASATVWQTGGTGAVTGYTLTQYGRTPAFLTIPLPADLANVDARNTWVALQTMTGEQRIFRGELNVAVPAGTVVPSAAAPIPGAPVDPATPPVAVLPLTFGTPVYTSSTRKLRVPLNNAGNQTVNWTVVGYGGNITQPVDGFGPLPDHIVGSNAVVRARTNADNEIELTYPIPADGATQPVTPTPPPVQTTGSSTSPLPEAMIGHYSFNTNSRSYGGNAAEDNSRYEQFGLEPVRNNDGVRLPGMGTGTADYWIPPFLKQFKAVAQAANAPDKLGFYVTAPWDTFKVSPQGQDGPWQTGGISESWKRYVDNVFGYAAQQGMKTGIASWAGRGSGWREYITDDQRPVDHLNRLSNSDVRVPALRLFAALKPGFNVNNIFTTNAAGKYLADLKLAVRYLRPHQESGALTFFMNGTHTNGELGHDTRQDSPHDSWSDFHPDAIAALQTFLKNKYSNNLQQLNTAWFGGGGYTDWNQVTYPYTGDFGDFQGQRGIDCQEQRHIQLGDAMELMARVVWSELPGIVILNQFGQPFGGQGGILSTVDIPYLMKRVKKVATELNYGHKCVGFKYNPTPEDNHLLRGNIARYIADDATGASLIMHEDSYEPASGNPSSVLVSENMADAAQGAITGRSGDGVAVAAVLFSPSNWLGVDREGNPNNAANSVRAMFSRYFALSRRRTAASTFGTTDASRTITITAQQQLSGMGPNDYPWVERVRQQWLDKNGPVTDIRFKLTGFNLPV